MYYGEEIGMTDARIPFKKGLDPIAQKMKKIPRFLFDLADETPNRVVNPDHPAEKNVTCGRENDHNLYTC